MKHNRIKQARKMARYFTQSDPQKAAVGPNGIMGVRVPLWCARLWNSVGGRGAPQEG